MCDFWDMSQQKRSLLFLAGATMIGMPILAAVIGWIFDVDLQMRWTGQAPILVQLAVGVVMGLITGFSARFIISRDFMRSVRLKYARMFGNLNLSLPEVLFIAVCAGFGEELLFRGVIQPLLGIIITSVLFVAIHGYLNPKDWRVSVYGLFMSAVIFGFGLATDFFGIWSAIIAHTLVDVILLLDLGEEEESDLAI